MAKDFFHDCVKTALERDGWSITYRLGLQNQENDRLPFLAIPARIADDIEDLDLLKASVSAYSINIVIFDPENCRIDQWIMQ
ncbi:MAG: hypothetical protein KF852_01675 [Saprospiraceae bacterium]|nr:hypothetical protein [Saprospiraceae bacterium]